MTEPTEEARAELDAINAARKAVGLSLMDGEIAELTMLALDRHHNRTPPDPWDIGHGVIITSGGQLDVDALRAALKRMFPDG